MGRMSCCGDHRVFMKIDCVGCDDHDECRAIIAASHPEFPAFRVSEPIGVELQAVIDKGRASIARTRQLDKEARALEREATRSRKIAARPPAMTGAERSRRYRLAKKSPLTAPKIDPEALEAERGNRRASLEARLSARPLPPALRHLLGREEELATAWLARELCQVPEDRTRAGQPRKASRIAEVYDSIRGVPRETKVEAMKRKLRLVDHLEDLGVWPKPPTD